MDASEGKPLVCRRWVHLIGCWSGMKVWILTAAPEQSPAKLIIVSMVFAIPFILATSNIRGLQAEIVVCYSLVLLAELHLRFCHIGSAGACFAGFGRLHCYCTRWHCQSPGPSGNVFFGKNECLPVLRLFLDTLPFRLQAFWEPSRLVELPCFLHAAVLRQRKPLNLGGYGCCVCPTCRSKTCWVELGPGIHMLND